jgi:hypothetical protein
VCCVGALTLATRHQWLRTGAAATHGSKHRWSRQPPRAVRVRVRQTRLAEGGRGGRLSCRCCATHSHTHSTHLTVHFEGRRHGVSTRVTAATNPSCACQHKLPAIAQAVPSISHPTTYAISHHKWIELRPVCFVFPRAPWGCSAGRARSGGRAHRNARAFLPTCERLLGRTVAQRCANRPRGD